MIGGSLRLVLGCVVRLVSNIVAILSAILPNAVGVRSMLADNFFIIVLVVLKYSFGVGSVTIS